MDLTKFKALVADQNEREKVVTWIELQEYGAVQLLTVERRNSRFGECWLAKNKTTSGVLVFSWIPSRFINEVKRKAAFGHSIYWMSCGVEKYHDKTVKSGDSNRRRNVYEIQFVKDDCYIPLSAIFQDGE